MNLSAQDVFVRIREAAEGFLLPLRMNEGFDSAALDELCDAVESCAELWKGTELIPKQGALALAELYPAIDSCAYLYEDDERQRIVDAAARVWGSVAAVLHVPEK
jgi:hypothetical protein